MQRPPKSGQSARDAVDQALNELLQRLIRGGEFKRGQQFLTEREVSKRFGVSRVTANKALSHLVVEGIIEFRKRVGALAHEGVLDYGLQSPVSFTRKATLAGKRTETRVQRLESMAAGQADGYVRNSLRLVESDPLYDFERLRLAAAEPAILERCHPAARFCPGWGRTHIKRSPPGLSGRNYRLPISAAEENIEAVNPREADACYLRVPAGTAALGVHAIGRAEAPLWREDTLYRGDRYQFHNAIGAAKRPRPANLVICEPQHVRSRPVMKREPLPT